MAHARRRKPTSEQATHPFPAEAAVLAAPTQRAIPQPPDAEAKQMQRRAVHGHTVISDVSTHHRAQPVTDDRDGLVQAAAQFGFHLSELRLQALAYRLPQHREASIAPFLGAGIAIEVGLYLNAKLELTPLFALFVITLLFVTGWIVGLMFSGHPLAHEFRKNFYRVFKTTR